MQSVDCFLLQGKGGATGGMPAALKGSGNPLR
jgi:hypothetical protein